MRLKQMLHIEIVKLNRFDYYLFASVYFLIAILIPLGIKSVIQQPISIPDSMGLMQSAGTKLMFFGVVVALAKEYTNNANRKRLINGYGRLDLYFAQLVVVGLYILTLTVLTVLALPVIAMTAGGFSRLADFQGSQLFGMVLSNFAWGLFAMLLINIFKRPLWAVLLYFGLNFAEFIFKIIGQIQQTNTGQDYMIYFSQMELFNALTDFNQMTWTLVLVLGIYLILYQVISIYLLKTREF